MENLKSKDTSTDRLERIKQAALHLFSKKGFHAVSVSQVAKEASVSKGLIYNYFESKEELLLGVMNDLMHAKTDIVEQAMQFEDPKDELRFFLDQFFETLDGRLSFLKMTIPLAMQDEPIELVHRVFQAQIEGVIQHVASVFASLGFDDAEGEVWTFSATLNGVALGLVTMGDRYPLELVKAHIYNQYEL